VLLAVEINAFRLNRSEYYVPVSVKIPGSELSLARGRGAPRTHIDVIGEIRDDRGITHRNLRDRLDIRLDEEDAAAWGARPLQYETGFTLLPGAYVLKVLVRDSSTGRIGTYQTPFVVRNAEHEVGAVPISTVVLGSQQLAARGALYSVQQKIAADAVNPLVVEGRQLLPSVTRVFSTAADLFVLLHAYQTAAVTPQPIVAYAGLYRDGVKVRETPPLITGAGPANQAPATPISLTISLDGLTPGDYDCQVTVLSPQIKRVTFWRARVMLVHPPP
jgi:hypothetical protein